MFKDLVDFRGAHFHGDVGFGGVAFSESAWFSKTTFSGDASFNDARFSERAWFNRANFSENAEFGGVKFSGQADFNDVTFSREALFGGVTFSREAWFSGATFSGDAQFGRPTLSGDKWRREATFLGYASFRGATFSGDARFNRVSFLELSNFDFTRFHEIVSFNGVDMSGVHFYFRNTFFERGLSVDEDKWSKSGYRLLTEDSDLIPFPKDSDLRYAVDSYQALRQGFRNMGHYTIAGELFYREMICREKLLTREVFILSSLKIKFPENLRRFIRPLFRIGFLRTLYHSICMPLRVEVKWRNLPEWIWMKLFHLSCGFGERPRNVIFGSILTILIFAGFYINIVETNRWGLLISALLLSIDAFTPGKFLNISFKPLGDLLVQFENILGWFMLALFLLVFTRKMIRS